MSGGAATRITSYNVCYTKLLRLDELRIVAEQGDHRRRRVRGRGHIHRAHHLHRGVAGGVAHVVGHRVAAHHRGIDGAGVDDDAAAEVAVGVVRGAGPQFAVGGASYNFV